MGYKIYDNLTHRWRNENKKELMEKIDIEGKSPCEKCWKHAKHGVYVWPVKDTKSLKRCKFCGRVI